MSAPDAPAGNAGAKDVEQALALLIEALAVLDANNAPPELRARLSGIIDDLASDEQPVHRRPVDGSMMHSKADAHPYH